MPLQHTMEEPMAELSMIRIIANFEILHTEVKMLRLVVKCLAMTSPQDVRKAAISMIELAAEEKPKFATDMTAEYLSEIGITGIAADWIAALQRQI